MTVLKMVASQSLKNSHVIIHKLNAFVLNVGLVKRQPLWQALIMPNGNTSFLISDAVNEQPVGFDVTFPPTFEVTYEFMIAMPRL